MTIARITNAESTNNKAPTTLPLNMAIMIDAIIVESSRKLHSNPKGWNAEVDLNISLVNSGVDSCIQLSP
ncbi:hypothetical protein PSCICO_37940 [Pseudomonas cichorii]|nr:hypothetical protein PSCICO_37940 [Pseudomonas cichorii]